MKKSILKLASIVVVMTAFSFGAIAQSFGGIIEFKRSTTIDTTTYMYYVKDNKVRLDEIDSKSHGVAGTFLIDLDAKKMLSLNHDRKLYMDQAQKAPQVVKGTCTVKKGATVKNLQGYKCNEYIVSNTEENTTVTYYIADGKFTFFERLLRQLNRKEKSSTYFLQIQDVKNMFPMLSITTDSKGKVTERLEVTKITKKDVEPSMLEVPKGYNKFEK